MVERLLALAVLVASGVYVANALPLPVGTTARPGPGFFPLAVGAFGTAVALAWLLRALVKRSGAPGAAEAAEGRGRVGATAGLLVVYCLLLPWAGFPLTALLFTALLLRALGGQWMAALVIGVASAAGSYYLFAVLLGVPLPRGALLD